VSLCFSGAASSVIDSVNQIDWLFQTQPAEMGVLIFPSFGILMRI
jgi:hypothetical protein